MTVPGCADAHPGAVVVPAPLAGEVLRRLLRDLAGEVRGRGTGLTPAARQLLWDLRAADCQHSATASDDGSRQGRPSTLEISARDAAERLECSPRWVRHLLAAGQISGRQIGRTWLIDATSLEDYRHDRARAG